MTEPISRDSSDVVAGEIDQHDMFGALLRIVDQFLGQRPVFIRRRAAAPRPGQGTVGDDPILDAAHDLGRCPDERDRSRAEIEHERAGIDHAQRAVDVERPGARFGAEALTEHDLERIAGVDVLPGLLDSGLELGPREVGGHSSVEGAAGRIDVGQLDIRHATLKTFHKEVGAAAGVGVCGADILLPFEECVGDDEDGLGCVVEDHHAVVEAEREIGDVAVVGRGVRKSFDVPHSVISGVADRAAGEPG